MLRKGKTSYALTILMGELRKQPQENFWGGGKEGPGGGNTGKRNLSSSTSGKKKGWRVEVLLGGGGGGGSLNCLQDHRGDREHGLDARVLGSWRLWVGKVKWRSFNLDEEKSRTT